MNSKEFLVKTNLSSHLIEDLKKSSLIKKDILTFLEQEFTTANSIVDAREKFQKFENIIDETLFYLISQELKEIQEDLAWSKSEKGKYIIKINSWFDSFKKEFRSISEYDDIYIGAHPDILCIIVTGKVDEQYKNNLIQFLLKKNPPYKLKTQFF